MSLDDAILRELATPEGATSEDQKAFISGLRQLIMDLRNRKISGMTDIASAIAVYRRNFLQDDSRVIKL